MHLLVRSLLARDLTCLLCGAQRVRRSSRPYGTVIATLFVALRCQECGQRFPMPRRVGGTRVTVWSRIPPSDPAKGPVEAAIQEALRAIPGRWTVEVRHAAGGERWFVSFSRPGGLRLSLTSREQHAESVYDGVQDALRKQGLIV
jgi:hypothetical protein